MRYLSVRNWSQFQHYGNRAPPWIKLHSAILEDAEFEMLPDATRAHLMLIWLLAGRTNNRIPADAGWIGRKIGASEPVDLDSLLAGRWLVFEDGESALAHDASKTLAPDASKTLAHDASTNRIEERRLEESREESEPLSLPRQPTTTRSKKKPPALDPEMTDALLGAYRSVHPATVCRTLPPDAIECVKRHRGTEYEVTPERLALVAAWTLTWRDMDPASPPKPGNLLRATRWGNYVVEAEEWDASGRPSRNGSAATHEDEYSIYDRVAEERQRESISASNS